MDPVDSNATQASKRGDEGRGGGSSTIAIVLSLCAALVLVGAVSFLIVRRQRGGKAAAPTGTEIETHEYEEVNVAAPSSPTYSSTTPPVYAETDMDGIGAGAADPEYVLSSKIHEDNYVRGLEKSASPERQMARLSAHAVSSSDYAIPIMRPVGAVAPELDADSYVVPGEPTAAQEYNVIASQAGYAATAGSPPNSGGAAENIGLAPNSKGADYDTAPQAEICVAQDVLRAARPSSGGTKRTELIPSANGGGYETVSASELRAAEAQTRAQSNIPIGQHVPEGGGGTGHPGTGLPNPSFSSSLHVQYLDGGDSVRM